MNYTVITANNSLYHHGILGQKWGVRRYQNKDGTLTDVGRKRLQQKEFKEAKKTQSEFYKNDFERMLDYRNNSKTIQERSKELNVLSEKAKNLDFKLEEFYEENDNKAYDLAKERANKRAKEEVKDFSSLSEKDQYKISEYYMYDGGELDKARKEINANSSEYKALKKEYNDTIKAYKEQCKTITNEIIGDYGSTKISGLGATMTYKELVYYALSSMNTMFMFSSDEDMGRK